MKREALIRDLRRYARDRDIPFTLDRHSGKGSHYRLRLGDRVTTIQSGELSPLLCKRICEQLHVNLADL